jgi:hypothetical protein
MDGLVFILIIALAAYVWHLRSRLEEVERRVRGLEYSASVTPPPMPVWPPVPPPLPEKAEQPPPLPALPPLTEEPPPVPPLPETAPPALIYVPPIGEPAPAPSLAHRLRRVLGDEEWETLVGGSLLNKLGALVLVIGIALFLGFSFARMTAAGRASIALLVSLGVLGAGVWVERRERYRVFARGLIGAGWAGLYATAYASYAVPEARVIDNPFLGSLGMLLVAAGMIGHSLKYRAQAVTGVAFFAAFSALAATPSSPFAVVALIPLAASVLWLAWRFAWFPMALFGLAATYLTCISRGDSGAPLRETQPLFLAYWLLFDAFDLMRTWRRTLSGGVEWLYPANLAGFVGLSYLAWTHHAPGDLWIACAGGAGLFLVDSVARMLLRPPSSFDPSEDLAHRVRAGSYEASVFVSAVLAGLAMVARVPGVWLSAGLAVEAEILFLAGVRFESRFLRRMGMTAFAHSLLRMTWGQPAEKSVNLGHSTWNWTPPALFHAVLFYLNRILRQPNLTMGSAAALLVATAIALEVKIEYAGMAWIVFGVVLLGIGLRRKLLEFRVQAYALLVAGVLETVFRGDWIALSFSLAAVYGCALLSRRCDVPERREFAYGSSAAAVLLAAVLLWRVAPREYLALAWFALALAVLELGIRRLPEELGDFFAPTGLLAIAGLIATHSLDFAKFPATPVWLTFFGAAAISGMAAVRSRETEVLRVGAASIAAALAIAAIWLVVPDPWVTMAWTAPALAALELGAALRLIALRRIALGAFLAVYLRLFASDLPNVPGAPMTVVSIGLVIAGLYWLWRGFLGEPEIARIIFWAAPVPLVALIERQSGSRNTAAGWMAVSLVLLLAGARFRLRDARLQSYAIGFLSFAAALAFDVQPPRLLVSCAVVAGLFAGQYVARKSVESAQPAEHAVSGESRAAIFFSLLGTLLAAAVLYGEVSGGLLTVSWGFEGLALLACGFALRERILRLEGLALLLICILKLFVYDLRNLETLYRILSFVALGLILLAVSWIYTRFRDHIRKLL